MKIGEQFSCVECGYNEYWAHCDLIDENGLYCGPCYTCKYCEQSVCWECEEKHNKTNCGDKPDQWEAKQLLRKED